MDAAHARVTVPVTEHASATKPDATAAIMVMRPSSEPQIKLRVLLAERRASAQSELSRRLDRAGHEMLARVTSGQGALDYAALLRPDVVLIAPVLEDGPGVMAALTLTRELPGIAAVVLSTHPAAANPAARPNWGAVTVLPADAEAEDLDAELRRAVDHARSLANEVGIQGARAASPASAARPADFAPAVPSTPQYVTPMPNVPVSLPAAPAASAATPVRTAPAKGWTPAGAPVVAAYPAPAPRPVTPSTPAPRLVPPSEPALRLVTPPAPQVAQTRPVPSTAPVVNPRPALSFTDEDLLAIGPFVEVPFIEASEMIRPTPKPAAPAVPAVVVASATPTPLSEQPAHDSDIDVITEAAECLLERTGLSRSDAMRLMEQEAADTGQRLLDVAHAVLGRDGTGAEVAQVA